MIKVTDIYYRVYQRNRKPVVYVGCNVEDKPKQLPLVLLPKTGRRSILQAKAVALAEWLNKHHTNNIDIKQLFRYDYEWLHSEDKTERAALGKHIERIWAKIEKRFKKEGKEYLEKADQEENIQERDANSCAVMAVIKLTDGKKTYDEMYHMFKKHGRKFRQGTHLHITLNVLKEFGKTVVDAYYFSQHPRYEEQIIPSKKLFPKAYDFDIKGIYPGVKKFMPHRLEKKFLDKSKRYLGQTNRHIFAICNGIIDDWARDTKRPIRFLYEIK